MISSIGEDSVKHANHPAWTTANECWCKTTVRQHWALHNTQTHSDIKHRDTNLSYSSLVTLYIEGSMNKRGFEKRRNKEVKAMLWSSCVLEKLGEKKTFS